MDIYRWQSAYKRPTVSNEREKKKKKKKKTRRCTFPQWYIPFCLPLPTHTHISMIAAPHSVVGRGGVGVKGRSSFTGENRVLSVPRDGPGRGLKPETPSERCPSTAGNAVAQYGVPVFLWPRCRCSSAACLLCAYNGGYFAWATVPGTTPKHGDYVLNPWLPCDTFLLNEPHGSGSTFLIFCKLPHVLLIFLFIYLFRPAAVLGCKDQICFPLQSTFKQQFCPPPHT